mgnify:CR=1 FL=1
MRERAQAVNARLSIASEMTDAESGRAKSVDTTVKALGLVALDLDDEGHTLVHGDRQRLGAAGRALVEARHDFRRTLDGLEQVYAAVTGQRTESGA